MVCDAHQWDDDGLSCGETGGYSPNAMSVSACIWIVKQDEDSAYGFLKVAKKGW